MSSSNTYELIDPPTQIALVKAFTKIEDDQKALEEFILTCLLNYADPQKALDGLTRKNFIHDSSQLKNELDKLVK